MPENEDVKNLNLGNILPWYLAIITPINFLRVELLPHSIKHDGYNFVARLWLIPISLVALIDLLAVNFAGDDLHENGVIISVFLVLGAARIFSVPAVICILMAIFHKDYKVNSILVLYTVVLIYQPIYELFSVQQIIDQYHITKLIYGKGIGFDEAISYFINNADWLKSLVTSHSVVIGVISAVIIPSLQLFTSVLFSEALSFNHSISRVSAYTIVCLSFFLAFVPERVALLAEFLSSASFTHH